MGDIQWILFSKHRTLQAAACIESLTVLSDVTTEDITVLYVDAADISYAPLERAFPCRFIRQTDFYSDVMGILRSSTTPFVAFLVDDLIFRDAFSAAHISGLLRTHADLDTFSLRLGTNIEDGQPPTFEVLEDGVLSWTTNPGYGTSWNYYWELTGGIYRRAEVIAYMHACPPTKITFPNPMESYYYEVVPNILATSRGFLATIARPKRVYWRMFRKTDMRKRIACYEQSRTFTQGVNMVANRSFNYHTHGTPQQLHALFLKGYRIDFRCLRNVRNTKPHPGRQYFRVVSPYGDVHPLTIFHPTNAPDATCS